MSKELPKRKHPRLKEYDYSSVGAYFITICVEDMRKILGEVVGRNDLEPERSRAARRAGFAKQNF